MTDKSVYTLKHPVQIGTETISQVKFGKIKGKHMRSLPGVKEAYTMGTIMDLAAKVMGESSAVLDEMEAEDVMGVCEIVGEMLGAGQTIGETA